MAIVRLDVTRISVVAVCKLCSWRELHLSRAAAWSAAAAHERSWHPQHDGAQRRARG